MFNRQQLEEIEEQAQTPYAAKSRLSRGRLYQEPEHDYRTSFQRDRDRIVHTSAFRRLEYKTQVFVNHEGDYYRTRLTHTLEVTQIGRTIARALGVNETLTEAICLAHDLGHTPFGHAGQDTMAELMKNHGGFEHNKQSFRIVTRLEKPYPQYTGLNLTHEVLEGICKHATEYDMPDGNVFLTDGYPTIEAQIGNFADEIAYNNHDLDDGIKSGLLKFADLKDLEIWQQCFHEVRGENHHLPKKFLRRLTVKTIINLLVTDLIRHTSENIQNHKITSLEDVRKKEKNLVAFSDTVKKKNTELKRFLFGNLYRHWRVERMADKARRMITELFNAYIKNPNIIPAPFRKGYDTKKEPVERIVCDYIAGMTDRYALDEYAKLFDPYAKV